VSGTILIYGATGYTGKLIAKAAADARARPILAGRPPAARERACLKDPIDASSPENNVHLARLISVNTGVAVVIPLYFLLA
jgi:short subunit dehydrogenase-like uncharacterized protein